MPYLKGLPIRGNLWRATEACADGTRPAATPPRLLHPNPRTPMLELDFTTSGYVYMALIWAGVGLIAVVLARRQGRNPALWCVACLDARDRAERDRAERDQAERDRAERVRAERAQAQAPADGDGNE